MVHRVLQPIMLGQDYYHGVVPVVEAVVSVV